MTPQCAWLLDNGQRCRCASTRGSRFCRHHPPAAARRRSVAGPQPEEALDSAPDTRPGITPWQLRSYWRMVHGDVASAASEALPDIYVSILDALVSRAISPRCAGLIIRAILDRSLVLRPAFSDRQREAAIAAFSCLDSLGN